MRTQSLSLLLASACLVPAASAQSFSYANFPSGAGLALNGNAQAVSNVLRLTESAGSQIGSAFHLQSVAVSGGFDTTFVIQVTLPVFAGADGMSFVIHNDPRGTTALGADGSALGYSAYPTSPPGTGFTNSLALELDMYDAGPPSGLNDPSDNHFSLHTNGTGENSPNESVSIGQHIPGFNLSDGLPHTVRLRYVPGTLELYLEGSPTPSLSVPYNFATGGTWIGGGTVAGPNLLGGTHAYVGFTAATGGAYERHDVLSWTWNSGASGPSVYCTGKINSLGCLPAMAHSGFPSISGGTFTVSASNLVPLQLGVLFWSTTGQAVIPFQGGTLCISPPVVRTSPSSSGGTGPGCDGAMSFVWTTAYFGSVGLTPGQQINCQFWTRDPGVASGTGLTNAVQFVISP